MGKTTKYKPIYIQRGIFDKVQIGLAAISYESDDNLLFGTVHMSIINVKIMEPFKSLMKKEIK